jgi:hypothetical protein
MSTIITRGYGQARQGIITRGYGRSLEQIIEEAIEDVTGLRSKKKGRSRASRTRRDEESGVEEYTLEVTLSKVNGILIDEPIRNKILENIQKDEGLKLKVSDVRVKSVTTETETNITVRAMIIRKK